MRGQYAGYVDGGGAVGATNDADCSGLENIELQYSRPVQQRRANNGTENTELRSRTQKQGFGVSKQRAEIGHRPYTHENQQRTNGTADNHRVEVIQHAIAVAVILRNGVGHRHFGITGFFHRYFEGFFQLRRNRLSDLIGHIQRRRQCSQNLGVATLQSKVNSVFSRSQGKPCLRNIRQNATKPDGHQQQRLKLLVDRKIEKQQANSDHDHLAQLDVEQATACPQCH